MGIHGSARKLCPHTFRLRPRPSCFSRKIARHARKLHIREKESLHKKALRWIQPYGRRQQRVDSNNCVVSRDCPLQSTSTPTLDRQFSLSKSISYKEEWCGIRVAQPPRCVAKTQGARGTNRSTGLGAQRSPNPQRASDFRNRADGVSQRARALVGAALLLAHDTSAARKLHPWKRP